jgi:hypothetical protein
MDTAAEDLMMAPAGKKRRRLTTKDIEAIMQFGLLMPQPQLPDIFGTGAADEEEQQLAGLLG